MKRIRLVMVLVLALSLALVGCSNNGGGNNGGGSNGADGNTATGSRNGEGATGGNAGPRALTIALTQDVKSPDLYAFNDHVSWMAMNNLYNGLFKRDARGDIVPDLAESIEALDDTTWEVTLKQGVKFHNGDEFTGEDVKFTLERAATDETLLERSSFSSIKEVQVIEPYKVHIITHEPNPLFLGILARTSAVMYPKAHIETNGIEAFNDHPIGTGPYRFVEWRRGSHVTLEPFADYFEGAAENWSEVVFRILPEASTRVGELLTNGVDIIPAVTSNDWERIKGSGNAQLAFSLSNRVAHIVPKATPGTPLADPRVREAVELAIDNETIINSLLGGEATPTRTRITPGNFGANEELFDVVLYDPDRAKQLLADAGYANGLELSMQSSSGRYARDREVAEVVAGMLEAVGIKVKLEFPEWNTYLELRRVNEVADLHMLWFANSYYDAHIMISEHITGTRNMENLGFDNPELLDIPQRAENNMNDNDRAALYRQAQEIEAEERMRIYLYLEHNAYGVGNGVNFTPRLDEMFRVYDIKAN